MQKWLDFFSNEYFSGQKEMIYFQMRKWFESSNPGKILLVTKPISQLTYPIISKI